jgi:hypothetical protein
MGLHKEAIKEFQKAPRINPENALAHKNLEIALKKELEQNNKFEELC